MAQRQETHLALWPPGRSFDCAAGPKWELNHFFFWLSDPYMENLLITKISIVIVIDPRYIGESYAYLIIYGQSPILSLD
jgi:hypothetical protein